ncbi:hypothetical protein JB92DRAFT_2929805, partial [Gautieria morchelliformis]
PCCCKQLITPLCLLRLLGFVSLSALLFAVVISENIHRHPVFFNFGCGIHGFHANRGNVGCGQGPQYSGQFYEVDVSIKMINNAILCTAVSAS